jgi:hypothetical protein
MDLETALGHVAGGYSLTGLLARKTAGPYRRREFVAFQHDVLGTPNTTRPLLLEQRFSELGPLLADTLQLDYAPGVISGGGQNDEAANDSDTCARSRRTCSSCGRHRWTFAEVPDVEPTNNAAERGLRAAVIHRKLSLGSRSQGGERTIQRLLSVDQTCRLQHRSLYGYLSDVLSAKARGDPVPVLT